MDRKQDIGAAIIDDALSYLRWSESGGEMSDGGARNNNELWARTKLN